MTYPRKYAVATAAGDHLKDLDWDPMVDAANGMTIAGGITIQYPFSYIVRNVGGVFDAVNGNGVKTYGGSSDVGGVDGGDANAVIQAALDDGARIFLRDGVYPDIALEPNPFNQLIGESWSAELQQPDNATAPVIDVDMADGVVLANFKIDANMAGQPAPDPLNVIPTVRFQTSNYDLVEHVYISNMNEIGVRTFTTSNSVLIDKCRFNTGNHQGVNIAGQNNTVRDSLFIAFDERAMVMADFNYCKFLNNYVDQHLGVGEGIQLSYCGLGALVDGNTIIGCNGGQSMVLEAKTGGATALLSQINIVNNYIAETTGVGGIQLSCDAANSLYNVNIQHNQIFVFTENILFVDHNNGQIQQVVFRNNVYSGLIDYATIDATIGVFKYGDNMPEVLSNSGAVSGNGAQQTIAHGLSVNAGGTKLIPTRVYVTDWDSGANPYPSAASDDTNIYVTAVNGKGYYWRAEFVT
jgi:hypothetical protein